MAPRVCAVLALACFLLAAALPAATAALSCAAGVKKVTTACHDDMIEIMWAASGDLPVPTARIDSSAKCCKAAVQFFDAAWLDACQDDAAVLKWTSQTNKKTLDVIYNTVLQMCPGASPDTLKAYTYPSGGGGNTISAASVGVMAYDPNAPAPPVGGTGSNCNATINCKKTVCLSKVGATKFDRFKAKCDNTKDAGFCNIGTIPTPPNFVPGIEPFAIGTSQCGRNNTVIWQYYPSAQTDCISCCQPMGAVLTTRPPPKTIAYGVNMCSAAAISGCFPGAARVSLEDGTTRALRHLAVGDRVQIVKADGTTSFDDVVFFDHELDGETHSFVRISLVNGDALELTPGHFVPVGESLAAAVMTRARDVAVGAPLLVVSKGAAAAEPVLVDAVEAVTRVGMFAPVTKSGVVVIDGVLASSYSDWILDPIFDYFGVPEKLPAAMHAVHAPLRAGYAILGPRALRALSPIISGLAQLDARQIAAGLGMASV